MPGHMAPVWNCEREREIERKRRWGYGPKGTGLLSWISSEIQRTNARGFPDTATSTRMNKGLFFQHFLRWTLLWSWSLSHTRESLNQSCEQKRITGWGSAGGWNASPLQVQQWFMKSVFFQSCWYILNSKKIMDVLGWCSRCCRRCHCVYDYGYTVELEECCKPGAIQCVVSEVFPCCCFFLLARL